MQLEGGEQNPGNKRRASETDSSADDQRETTRQKLEDLKVQVARLERERTKR